MIDDAIQTLEAGTPLSEDLAYTTFSAIMRGDVAEDRITRLLSLLAQRPVTTDELTGAARVMREQVTPVPVAEDIRDSLIDTCGTGGAPKTFNVSTAAALIVAGAGRTMSTPIRVAKHGNRSRTGRGSAEVLMMLGVNADASPEVQARCLEEAGVCFCFAIHHHPATRHAMPSRLALGHPTIFNLLGPLTNPAGAKRQVIGCFDAQALETMAQTLQRLGAERAMVCRGDDGLDEITTTTTSTIYALFDGRVSRETFDPGSLGLERTPLESLQVSTVEEGAHAIQAILAGDEGPQTSIALVNAAAGLVVSGVCSTMVNGYAIAHEAIVEGDAMRALEDLVRISND